MTKVAEESIGTHADYPAAADPNGPKKTADVADGAETRSEKLANDHYVCPDSFVGK